MNQVNISGRKFTKQLLSLPIILGFLIATTGISGIVITKMLSNKIIFLNESALGPILSFNEINDTLKKLDVVNKLANLKLTADDRNAIVSKFRSSLKKITRLEKVQLAASSGQVYSDYLSKWDGKWNLFATSMNEVAGPNAAEILNEKSEKIEEVVSELSEEMLNIDGYIQSNVAEVLTENSKFSNWAIFFLVGVLAIGLAIAAFSSAVILKNIKKLFAVIDEGKRNIETLLNNLEQGYLTFGKDGVIQPGVSRAATELFGNELAGKPFSDSLPVDASQKKSTLVWQELVFAGDLDFEDFDAVAPKYFEVNDRYIELQFRPIYDSGKDLEKVICVASDRTAERRLRQLAEDESSLVKLVIGIINDPNAFLSFIDETARVIDVISAELKLPNPSSGTLFRGMHSIKGSCAAFHILSVAKLAHKYESKLAELQVAGQAELNKNIGDLISGVEEIKIIFENYLKANSAVFETLIGKDKDRTKPIPISTIDEVCKKLLQQVGEESGLYHFFLENFVREKLALSFNKYVEIVRDLASRQGKKAQVKFKNPDFSICITPYQPLLTTLIHIFRNAVDHGIEEEFERTENQKAPIGTISVEFKHEETALGKVLKIVIEDDGRGIDWENVRSKALAKGLISESQFQSFSPEECMQLLFLPGFSTKDEVTDISGRGVGTDAVLFEAKKLGGGAWFFSKQGNGTTFTIEVPHIDETPRFLMTS